MSSWPVTRLGQTGIPAPGGPFDVRDDYWLYIHGRPRIEGSNSPDVNYRPPEQKYVDPTDPPGGYYEASDAPLRTRVPVV